MGYASRHLSIVDPEQTRCVQVFLLVVVSTPKVILGTTCELSQQELEPKPNLGAVLPIPVTDNDGDGEEVAGPTVEAHVELAKTISKQSTVLGHG